MNKRLFKKAFRDLFSDRRKALSSLLAIVIGMLAFGTLLFSYQIITNELVTTYSSINPPSGSLVLNQADEQLEALTEDFAAIEEYEVKAKYDMRGQTKDGEWTALTMIAAKDFTSFAINKVFPIEGAENPGLGEMLIERDAIAVSGKSIGDMVAVTMPDGQKTELKIVGIINDLSVHPATMHNTIYAYVSMETLNDLGMVPNKIDFKIKDNPYDREAIMPIGNEYVTMLEQNGYLVKGLSVDNTPGTSRHLGEYKTALFMLRAFSLIIFLFACLIMSSLITSILAQQIRQIGILKSFGTKSNAILCSYLLALFSVTGTMGMITLPASKFMANKLSAVMIRLCNMSLTHTAVPNSLYVVFLGVSFIVPLLIAIFFIRRATEISVKQAINDSGVPNVSISKPVLRLSFLQRPVMLTIRNAFRRKGRFWLNVLTLAISGVCFITVFVSMQSVSKTLTDNLNTQTYDYHFTVSEAQADQLTHILETSAEIKSYEYWGYALWNYTTDEKEIGNSYPVYAIPQNSKFITPDLTQGSWPGTGQTNEFVAGHKFLEEHPGVEVGDTVIFCIMGNIQEFQLVGEIKDFTGENIYVNEADYTQYMPASGGKKIVQVQFSGDLKGEALEDQISSFEKSLLNSDISILQSQTKANTLEILTGHYMTTFQTFLVIIFMVLIVSSFGMASTTNIQTLERTREISVMKAMGAEKKQIIKIITAESLFVGFSGWLLAAILAIPGMAAGIAYFSAVTLKTAIVLDKGAVAIGYLCWLLLVLIIGIRASKRPALRAAKMTICNASKM